MQSSKSVPILLASILLIFPAIGNAESKCHDFRALVQWSLGNGNPFTGPVFASLDGTVLIAPSAQWLQFASSTCSNGSCRESGSRLLLDFGNGNTLTTEGQGVYTPAYIPPPAFGNYRGTRKISSGTGVFAQASGVLVETGAFLVWFDQDGFTGRYNAEYHGTICTTAP